MATKAQALDTVQAAGGPSKQLTFLAGKIPRTKKWLNKLKFITYMYVFSLENLESRKTFLLCESRRKKNAQQCSQASISCATRKAIAKVVPEQLASQEPAHSGNS